MSIINYHISKKWVFVKFFILGILVMGSASILLIYFNEQMMNKWINSDKWWFWRLFRQRGKVDMLIGSLPLIIGIIILISDVIKKKFANFFGYLLGLITCIILFIIVSSL